MSVEYVKRLAGPYVGDGTGQRTFSFGFLVFEESDVYVAVAAASDSEPVDLQQGTDYTVSMNSDQSATPGGTITLTSEAGLAKDAVLVIGSAVDYAQTLDLTNYTRFPPERITTELDRIVVMIQQIVELLGRAVQVPPTASISPKELFYQLIHAAEAAAQSAEDAQEALAACEQIKQYIAQYSWDIPHLVNTLKDVENYPYDGYFWVGGTKDVDQDGIENVQGAALVKKYQNQISVMNLPAGVGDNTAVTATGSTAYRMLKDRFADVVNVKDFGAKGDGVTDDTKAIQAAVASNKSVVFLPEGVYKIRENISLNSGQSLAGQGNDYWDTWQPTSRLKKSFSKGTHLLFCGTGAKKFKVENISNELKPKVISGTPCPFTDFTNNDSTGSTPATPKPFSVGVKMNHNCGLRDLRIMLNYNGIDGYNDTSLTGTGDDWDVGLWVQDGNEANISNVQVCGYWKMAGTLLTENDGSTTMVGNPERIRFSDFMTQGVRGLLIRNNPQIDVLSNTEDTITIAKNASLRLTAFKACTLFIENSDKQNVTFTGSSVDGDGNVVLTGVSPSITGTVAQIRYPTQGNNFSNTVFLNSWISSFEHSSRKSSIDLGLPVSFAMEVDGFPVRNICFINCKIQTVFDFGNTLFGDCQDFKFIGSEFENGELIAYSRTDNPPNITENLRMVGCMISDSTGRSGFTPRGAFIDSELFPTKWGSEVFIIKNWREGNLELQYPNGNRAVVLQKDGGINIYQNGVSSSAFKIEQSGNIGFFGNSFYFDALENGAAFRIYGSKNAEFGGAISPITDNANSIGSGSKRWSQIFAATDTINTSDERCKQNIADPQDAMLKAIQGIDFRVFRFKDAVEKKGEAARIHAGVVAQEVQAAFAAQGLNAADYGLFCYDKWDDEYEDVEVVDQPEVLGENGEVVTPAVTHIEKRKVLDAGDRFGVRYTELLVLTCAGLRNQLSKIEKALAANGIAVGD